LTVDVFVGPTLAGRDVLEILPGAVLHPPIEHGDLLRLRPRRDDVVVIIDGFYHQRASVRHKEILALLADGVVVLGCSSMGALRAAELDEYGMIGNGAVYRMYSDGVLDADDEVAVVHTPAPDYRSLTVPSVVVRHRVAAAVRSGVLSDAEGMSIIDVARAVHYTERSWQAIWRAADTTDSLADALARLRQFVESNREAVDIKAEDARDTLHKIADGVLPGSRRRVESWVSGAWQNRFLGEWRPEFTVLRVDGVEITLSSIVRYQQLYLDDFPCRWQRFVMTRIADTPASGSVTSELALAAAARHGTDVAAVTPARRDYWLTEREAAELSAEAAMLRMLVRSYRLSRSTHELIADQPYLIEDALARRMVAEALAVNAEVASWGGKHSIDHLKRSALTAHLAQVWQVGSLDQRALLAAARDRGFESVAEAVGAARKFFLHKNFFAARAKRAG
jgi:hypothetical protein